MLQENPHEEIQPIFENEEELRAELRELFPDDDPVLAYTATLADLDEGDRVLDIGCGDGAFTFYERLKVGARGYVAGIDIDPEAIEEARDYADYLDMNVSFRVSDLTAIPYPDDYFDAVTCNFVTHHLSRNEKKLGFAEVLRVLKPGGRFFLSDYGPGKGINRAIVPVVMRMLFFLDETRNLVDNVKGLLPEQIEGAGFVNVEVLDSLDMRYLTLVFIKGDKPLAGHKIRAAGRND